MEELDNNINEIVKTINGLKSKEKMLSYMNYVQEKLEEEIVCKQNPKRMVNQMYPIQVLTWNLSGLGQTQKKSIERVTSLIEQLNVNIFCLQEIRDEEVLKQIHQNLQDSEKWEYQFDKVGRGYQYTEISATFYKISLYKLYAKQVGFEKFKFCRKPLTLFLQKDDLIFTVTNFHLKDGSRDSSQLEIELSNLKKLISGLDTYLKEGSSQFHMLIGDFNFDFNQKKDNENSIMKYFQNEHTVLCAPKRSMSKTNKIYDQIIIEPVKKTIDFQQIIVDEIETKLMNGKHISDHLPIAFEFNLKDHPQPQPQKIQQKKKK